MAVSLFRRFGADRIVAEKNNGGEMVSHVLHSIDPTVPVRLVTATRGKIIRAEPIAALYEQGRIHHLGVFKQLEAEMCSFVPGRLSPDRMDALVWAMTDLITDQRGMGSIPGSSMASTDAGSPFAH
jgi:phage terminase large subunit-like protein